MIVTVTGGANCDTVGHQLQKMDNSNSITISLQIKKLTLHASCLLAHLLLRLSSSLFIVLQMQLVVLANNTEWLALVILQVACVIIIHVDVGLHVIEVILRIVLGEMSTWVKICHRT